MRIGVVNQGTSRGRQTLAWRTQPRGVSIDMKVGRNDPCPCGSGRKHKKCCLDKPSAVDLAAGMGDVEWDDDETPTAEARSEFETMAREFEALLENQDSRADKIFELLAGLRDRAFRVKERGRLDAWLDRLEKERPDVCQQDWRWHALYRLESAIIDGRDPQLTAGRDDLVRLASVDLDLFHRVADLLAWRGHTRLLTEVLQEALPRVQTGGGIMDRALESFEITVIACTYFRLLEESPSLDPFDPAVHQRLPKLSNLTCDYPEAFLQHVVGVRTEPWSLQELADPNWETLFHLSLEFVGHVHRTEGVPYLKAELGRRQIVRYLRERHKGVLHDRRSMLDRVLHPRPPKPRPRPDHILCPDIRTLDAFLADLLDFLNPQVYRVVACLEMIPAWIRFLEGKGLVEAAQGAKVLPSLRGLVVTTEALLRKAPVDPAARAALRTAWPVLQAR